MNAASTHVKLLSCICRIWTVYSSQFGNVTSHHSDYNPVVNCHHQNLPPRAKCTSSDFHREKLQHTVMMQEYVKHVANLSIFCLMDFQHLVLQLVYIKKERVSSSSMEVLIHHLWKQKRRFGKLHEGCTRIKQNPVAQIIFNA